MKSKIEVQGRSCFAQTRTAGFGLALAISLLSAAVSVSVSVSVGAAEKLGETYRAIGTGATCEDAKTQARHAARVWRKLHCPEHHITKHASDDGFEARDPKAYRTPDDRVKCTKMDSEVYVYRDVTCVMNDVAPAKSKKASKDAS